MVILSGTPEQIKRSIIEHIIVPSSNIKEMVNKIHKYKADDHYQNLILYLYSYNADKIIKAYKENYLDYMVTNITTILFKDNKRKECRRMEKEGIYLSKSINEYEDSESVQQAKETFENLLEIVSDELNTVHEQRDEQWYRQKILQIWIDNNYKKTKVAKLLGIDRKTILKDLEKTMEILKQKANGNIN